MILAFGFEGASDDGPTYNELNRRGAIMSLLMQSPWGEVPTGARSSQHTWNEACSTVVFEYWANVYAASVSPTAVKHSCARVSLCCDCGVCCECGEVCCAVLCCPWYVPCGMTCHGMQGNVSLASAFKRASALSLASLSRWKRPTGEWNIVKNRFDPSLRHGYEDYSFFSQYNLLPASMLSTTLLILNERYCTSLS
jgi:hypothetical protein